MDEDNSQYYNVVGPSENRQYDEIHCEKTESEDKKPLIKKRGTKKRQSNLSIDVPDYDAFTATFVDRTSNSKTSRCYETSVQIFKIVAYILTFLLVLISALIAKGTLLFMTSQIRPGRKTPYCEPSAKVNNRLVSKDVALDVKEQAQWIWVLFFTFITPEVFTFIRSVRLITFKKYKLPKLDEFFTVCLFETLHTVGVALLVFIVLPELDVVEGVMLTNSLSLIPAILLAMSRSRKAQKFTTTVVLCLLLDVLAILCQLSGLIVWPIVQSSELKNATWGIPVGLLLTSFGWWENYLDRCSADQHKEQTIERNIANAFDAVFQYFESMKISLNESRTRYFVYMIVSVWKMLVFFCCMIGFVHLSFNGEDDRFFIFRNFLNTSSLRTLEVIPSNRSNTIYSVLYVDGRVADDIVSQPATSTYDMPVNGTAALAVWGIQIATAYACYISSKFACRTLMQTFGFAIPITITVPLAASLLIVACGMKTADVCFLSNVIPRYLYWECPSELFYTDFISHECAWIWLFWFVSYVWITIHIWYPKCPRLATAERIFLNPMYDTVFIDQSVALNRRRDDGEDIINDKPLLIICDEEAQKEKSIWDNEPLDNYLPESTDAITTIKACITMWHETPAEMLATLTSIMRLDEDQALRRLKQKYLRIIDKDYYKLEAHIFFDDAFKYYVVKRSSTEKEVLFDGINDYAKKLISLMDDAARRAYKGAQVQILPPRKYVTPYGGRLVYSLYGGNKLYVHFKDKMLIRHRKRWSQVMYMYYLLGIKLNNLNLGVDRKEVKAENTFLLALDGDIEFQPKAVLLLVDLMKKNAKVGAACGRIHPVGSGFIAWYQKFEYAIAHWLQKATEHVIGCVLCSPGCFSLFRAQALMENNVMKTYATRATEAIHYVQYDQGEDRWLCTLLLQQGYRVEYAAASDAYTHCPESFGEFYNQRRRWVPSTMANILDLLYSAKRTIKSNDDISIIYIFYQIVLMASSVIGPGTIFLMIVGSMSAVFGMDNVTATWLNIIPVAIFMLSCMLFKQNTQIKIATVLTCIYAFLMMAVIVGIFVEIGEEGWLAPSSISFVVTALLMVITALLHPIEVLCIFFGLVYWVVIPSMYLLLIIYSAMNMNDVSWGVREDSASDADKNAKDKEKEALAALKKNNKGSYYMKKFGLNTNNDKDEDEYCSFSCGNLCNINCCSHPKPKDEVLERMTKLEEKIDSLIEKGPLVARRSQFPNTETQCKEEEETESLTNQFNEISRFRRKYDGYEESPSNEINSSQYYWIDEDCLNNNGNECHLHLDEEVAWKYIIHKYLLPLTEDDLPEGRKVIENKLKKLRNNTVFAFFMINAMFVVTVLFLQLQQDLIYIGYPDIAHTNITWNKEENMISVERKIMKISPIGMVLIFIFAGLLIVQFIAMLFHRLGTVGLILATTDIRFCKKNKAKDDVYFGNKYGSTLVYTQTRDSITPETTPDKSIRLRNGRRNTLHDMELKKRSKKQRRYDMEGRFKRRLKSCAIDIPSDDIDWILSSVPSIPPEAASLLIRRGRKYSMMPWGSNSKEGFGSNSEESVDELEQLQEMSPGTSCSTNAGGDARYQNI